MLLRTQAVRDCCRQGREQSVGRGCNARSIPKRGARRGASPRGLMLSAPRACAEVRVATGNTHAALRLAGVAINALDTRRSSAIDRRAIVRDALLTPYVMGVRITPARYVSIYLLFGRFGAASSNKG